MDDARKYRGLRLRLPIAAHVAVDQSSSIGKTRKCGIQSVEWTPPRRQRIARIRVERKAATAVLPGDAGLAQHHAAAELVIDALDEADGNAIPIDRAKPHGIGRPTSCAPRSSPRHGN